jgi:hypothetical protein
MTDTQNWLNKYKPTKLSEVLGDKTQIRIIDQFIKQFTKKNFDPNKIPNPNIIVSGTNGVGKTLITDLVIKENGLDKVTADLSNVSVTRKTKRKKKVEKEVIGTNRTVRTYYMTLKNNKKLLSTGEYSNKKIALVFDDVSNISNPKEKEAIKAIIKHNNKYKEFPIIIIANMKHSKTVNELRKMVTYIVKRTHADGKKENRKIINEVIVRAPQYNDMEDFVKKICNKENLKIVSSKSDDYDIFVELIKHAQHDVRRLINILEELKLMHEDNTITLELLKQYQETSKKKDLDPGIYEATKMLLNKYTDMDSALQLYGEERATIPLMVHENYPLNIRQQYPKMSVDDQVDLIYDISKSMSESDKVDGEIYSKQCWSLQPVHGFYSCVMPSYYINKTPGKLDKMEEYKYTQDYNKTSIKKINNKVIKKAQEHQFLKKVSIYDFLYISSILKTLLDKKDFEKVAELMKPYDLKLKEIESIIKIDKIKKSKNTLTGKQRNILKELLDVDE